MEMGNMKNTAELKAKFLEYYAALPVQRLGADFIGVDEDTITNWKKADEDFRTSVSKLSSEWARTKASKIRNGEWLLERVMNDHFGQRTKQDITSGGEKIVPILGGLSVPSDNVNSETSEVKQED